MDININNNLYNSSASIVAPTVSVIVKRAKKAVKRKNFFVKDLIPSHYHFEKFDFSKQLSLNNVINNLKVAPKINNKTFTSSLNKVNFIEGSNEVILISQIKFNNTSYSFRIHDFFDEEGNYIFRSQSQRNFGNISKEDKALINLEEPNIRLLITFNGETFYDQGKVKIEDYWVNTHTYFMLSKIA